MYFVYFLTNEKSGRLYIGSTEDVAKRLKNHNDGKVRSTKAYRPWKLLEYKTYPTRSEAMKMEKFFKTGQQKELVKMKYGLVAKW